MLFWIFVILFVIGVICYVATSHTYSTFYEICTNIGIGCIIVGVAGFIITSFVLVVNNVGVPGCVEEYKEKYASLTYQYENDLYENDNDLGKKELIDQIQEWNTDLAWHKANQRDFWIGIFIPNIYDGFEFIGINKVSDNA